MSDSVSRNIVRDQMVLTLNIEEQGRDRSAVATAVTNRINSVLQQARRYSDFNTTLQGRSANKLTEYINNRSVDKGWQEHASIRIESKDLDALNRFAAQVQTYAAIGDIQYTVSAETVRAKEVELTREALSRFRQRSEMIVRNLGGSGYRIVQLDIGNGGNTGQSLYRGRAVADVVPMATMKMDSAPGEAELQLTVTGQIQIQGLP